MKSAWRSFRRNIGLIVLFGLIFAAAMGYYSYQYEPDIYEAAVGLYALSGSTEADAQNRPQTKEMLLRDAEQMVASPEVIRQVNEKLWPDGLDNTKIVLDGAAGTHMIRVKAYGTDPALCQRAAIAVSVVLTEQMQSAVGREILSLAERAEYPEKPVAPQRIFVIFASFVLAFLVMSILWLLFAPKRTKISASDALAENWKVSMLGSISDYRKDVSFLFRGKKAPHGIVLSQYVNRSAIEDVKTLSVALCKETKGIARSIAFASYQADEGKSTLAALLSVELCNQGKRVLLIDMDCYAPTLSRLFGVRGTGDLVHYLQNEATLDQVILPTMVSNLFLIDQLHQQSMAAQMAASGSFSDFLAQMYQEFDFVLFDTPPINLFSDAAALGSVLEGTLLVVAQERLTREQICEAITRLEKSGSHLLGFVMNFVKPRRVKQYRDYEDSAKN